MEVVCPAYYDGDNLDLDFSLPVVSRYGMFEWFVYGVYVGDGV